METKEKVSTLLLKILKTQKKIIPSMSLAEDLGMTSLHMMELISIIENDYDVVIPMNRIVTIRTVQDIIFALDHMDVFLKDAC